jgi:phosphonate dehydrogenase
MAKVVITNRVHPNAVNLFLRRGCDVEMNVGREPWSCDELAKRASGATGMIAFMHDCIDDAFLSRCPDLRIIAGVLKGYDNFDVQACTDHQVWFTVVPDGLTAATAELAIGLLIGISRHIVQGDAFVRQGYKGWRPIFCGDGIEHKTVGILGMGAVGQAVAKRLRGFDCKMLYFDEQQISPQRAAVLGVRFTPFEELLRASDFVIVALPLNQRSKHLLNGYSISQMRRGSYIVNPARGSIVDEEAVADALRSGQLAGYAADVYEMEDWSRQDRPQGICPDLLGCPQRTILTPHLGSAEIRARQAAEMEMAYSILDFLDGRNPRGAVNNPTGKSLFVC